MSTRRNPFLLRIYLGLIMLFNVAGFFYGWRYHQSILFKNPQLSALVLNIEILTVPFTLIACVALWNKQRWGIWLITVIAFIVFCIESYSSTNTLRTFGVFLSYCLLWALLYPYWKKLK